MSDEVKKTVREWMAEKKPTLAEQMERILTKSELKRLVTEKEFDQKYRPPKQMHRIPTTTSEEVKKVPDEWLAEEEFAGQEVLNPDGWRSAGIPWDEPITRETFAELLAASTIRLHFHR